MSGRGLWRRAFGALTALTALVACDPPPPEGAAPAGSASGASPNASILPGPRVEDAPGPSSGVADEAPTSTARRGLLADSSGRFVKVEPPPPTALRPDRPIPLDPLARTELAGVSLTMTMTWRDVPEPPKAPEVNAEGVAKAAAATQLGWTADVGEEGRVRLVLDGRAFPLPPRSELRARDDRLGTVLLWPDGDRYRPVAPGALRALLGERRIDVTPLAPGTVQKDVKVARPKIPGLPDGATARSVLLDSTMGSLELVLVQLPEAGRGGLVLCRMLIEIAGQEPAAPVCRAGELPVIGRFAWKAGGGFDLQATGYARRTDLSPASMAVPPPTSQYTVEGLPDVPFGVFLTKDDLAAFRLRPAPGPPSDGAPGEGLFADNRTDQLLYLLLDGVSVVAVPPRQTRYLVGPPSGTYVAQWRSFLGDHIEPAVPVVLPARLRVGREPEPERGAPTQAAAGP